MIWTFSTLEGSSDDGLFHAERYCRTDEKKKTVNEREIQIMK
jgi:hypothetical protein